MTQDSGPQMLACSFPVCTPRPPVLSFRRAAATYKEDVRVDFANLVAAFAVVLARANAATGVKIACPFVDHAGVEVSALELDVYPDQPFAELVKHFQERKANASTAPAPSTSKPTPCLVAAFDQVNLGSSPFTHALAKSLSRDFAATDLLVLAERNQLRCEFATELFNEASAGYLLDQVLAVIRQTDLDPRRYIESIDILGESERQHLTGLIFRPRPEPEGCLQERFAEQVKRAPHAVAVCCAGKDATYNELDQWSNALASQLYDLGVGAGDRVALEVEPSIQAIAGMIGICKTGAAYVPIDTHAPSARKREIAELAQPRIIIAMDGATWCPSSSAWMSMVPRGQPPREWKEPAKSKLVKSKLVKSKLGKSRLGKSRLGKSRLVKSRPEDTLYILFTSGSTGRPKGVQVSHFNVLRLFDTTEQLFGFRPDDVWLNAHTLTFDASVWEIYGALLTGGRVVIAPRDTTRDPSSMVDLIEAEKVSIVTISPTAFDGLRDAALERGASFPALRYVVLCAEALSPASLRHWFERWGDDKPALINMYGITETTVHSTFYRLGAGDVEDPRRKIGDGLPDTPIYLLDQHKRLVPFGTPAEIFVGGPGVSSGYLGAPPEHSDRFSPDPFSPHPDGRMYRSGDLGRRLPDGTIEYLGRLDQQVKIRGYRIELGEIESVLLRHPDVSAARAWIIQNPDRPPLLAAAIIPCLPSRPDPASLRTFLGSCLPEYMVPIGVAVVDEFPRTENGKLDVRRLPEPLPHSSSDHYVPELNGAAGTIAQAMAAILGIPHVHGNDNFFAHGGDSITAVRLAARLRAAGFDARVADIYKLATPTALASLKAVQANGCQTNGAERPCPTPEKMEGILDSFPATRLQRGMFLQAALNRGTYHDVLCYTIQLPVDQEGFKRALQAVVSSYDALRSSFDLAQSPPVQRVHARAEVKCSFYDLRGRSEADHHRQIELWAEAEQQSPFQESEPGLLRFGIHQTGHEQFVLAISVHHSILDGWSAASLVTELLLAYRGILLGKPSQAPSSRSLLRRYSQLEQEVERSSAHRSFWQQYLTGVRPFRLSSGRAANAPLPPVTDHNVPLSPETVQRLRSIAREGAVPNKTVWLALHAAVLSFLSGETEITVGLVSSGRLEEEGGDEELGLFLNTTPIRVSVAQQAFTKLLADVFEQETAIYPYRRFPLERIQQTVGVEGLCATAFNYTDFRVYDRLTSAGIGLRDIRYFERTDFELLVSLHSDPLGNGATLTVSHRLGAKDSAAVTYYSHLFESLAAAVSRLENEPVALLLEKLAPDLTLQIEPGPIAPHPPCILPLVAERISQNAACDALIHQDAHLSYRTVGRRVSFLREALLATGLASRERVACFVERGFDSIVAMLAVWAADGIYVPLDSTQPIQRQRKLVEQARCSLALRSSGIEIEPVVWQGPLLCVSGGESSFEPQHWSISNGLDEAYLLFTSGSTGEPKGVAMSHAALANLIVWQIGQPEFLQPRRISQFAPLMFDVSIQECLTSMASGGTLCVIDEPTRSDPEAMLRFLNKQAIEVGFLPPAVLQQVAAASRVLDIVPNSLTHVIVAGEALVITEPLRSFCAAAGVEIVNQYGPTETHVVTSHRLGSDAAAWPQRPSIGRPIDNVRAVVLGANGRAVSSIAKGELYIEGVAVALGYVLATTPEHDGKPAFAIGPNGAARYRTGDLVRVNRGLIEFEGRADDQVKVRGYRVEPGEISAVIRRHSKVTDCFVAALESNANGTQIGAFVVPADPSLSAEELVSYIRSHLPEYFVPQCMEFLDKLPTTRNGKVDRKTLLRNRVIRPRPVFQGSVTPAERRVLQVWSKVLGHPVSSPIISFFDAGGDSLRVLELYVALRNEYGSSFPMHDIFHYPNARLFASTRSPELVETAVAASAAGAKDVDRIVAIADRRRAARQERFYHE